MKVDSVLAAVLGTGARQGRELVGFFELCQLFLGPFLLTIPLRAYTISSMLPGDTVEIGEDRPAILIRWKKGGFLAIVATEEGKGGTKVVTKTQIESLNNRKMEEGE